MAKPPIVNDIRTFRFLTGEMTQADLGDRLGVTPQTIAALDAGPYSPTLEAALRIARGFRKPTVAVFRWEANSPTYITQPPPAAHPPPHIDTITIRSTRNGN